MLLLADALATDEETDENPLALAMDIFVPEPDRQTGDTPDGDDWSRELPDESRVEKNLELALNLAKSHKHADFSDSHFIHRISSLIHGSSHGMTPSKLAELGSNGYWDVFEEIASGTRSIDELVESRIDRDMAHEAVDELRRLGLVTETTDGELYAGNEVITTEPYRISSLQRIGWVETLTNADFDVVLEVVFATVSADFILVGNGLAVDGSALQMLL